MKSFLKSLLAAIIGVFIASFIIFLIFIGVLSAIISSSEKQIAIKPKSILYLELDKPIIDRQPATTISFGEIGLENRLGLNEILLCIKKAKDDSRIMGIYIESGFINAGYATVDEIRAALIDFRTSGKFVVAYSDIFTQKAYYAASACDKIFFNPAGMFMLNGLSIKTQYFKKTFEKLGIEPVIVKAGKYKSATEQFDSEKMSEPNREQLTELVQSMWKNISGEISKSRGISVDSLNYMINDLQFDTPEGLVKSRLVDSLVYKSDVITYLKNITGTPEKDNLSTVTIEKYYQALSKPNLLGAGADKIAIIYASGTIYDGEADINNIGSEKYAREIRNARRDSTIKAIVLRVNSPGGSSIASDVILDEIIRTKGIKPVIVSMGDLAASGGYYISCAADSIITGKNTLTGSIGVFFRSVYSNGFFDKLGITFDKVQTHKNSDMFSLNRPYTEDELLYLQKSIKSTYKLFLNRVSSGRELEYNAVDEIAQGRVWSGYDAINIGLADSYGGLMEALDAAKKLAGPEKKYQVIELPHQETALERIIKDLSSESKFESTLEQMGLDYSSVAQIKQLLNLRGIVAVMPYSLQVE